MEKLTKEEIASINQIADEHFAGDTRLAVAAHLHSVPVVKRCGNQIPQFADKKLIGQLKGQVTKANKPKK